MSDQGKSQTTDKPCTCHPDEAPVPCQHKYAFSECVAAYEASSAGQCEEIKESHTMWLTYERKQKMQIQVPIAVTILDTYAAWYRQASGNGPLRAEMSHEPFRVAIAIAKDAAQEHIEYFTFADGSQLKCSTDANGRHTMTANMSRSV